jgi:hypothetical protein
MFSSRVPAQPDCWRSTAACCRMRSRLIRSPLISSTVIRWTTQPARATLSRLHHSPGTWDLLQIPRGPALDRPPPACSTPVLVMAVLVAALNIGTRESFWWNMSTHIARHYDGIFDIENKAMVNVERGPQLKLGWPNVVLDAEDCAILPRPLRRCRRSERRLVSPRSPRCLCALSSAPRGHLGLFA